MITLTPRHRPPGSLPILFAALLCTGSALAQTPIGNPQAQAEAWVNKNREHYHLPGFSVAVIHQGERVFQGQTGWASVELQVPVNQNTLFRMGSISKMLTIALGARLAQEGMLSWQDSVNGFVPQTSQKGRGPTLAELAAHTGGIRHYGLNDFKDCDRVLTSLAKGTLMYPSLEEGLTIFIGDPLLFEPGKEYSYSSYGYNLLGVALEKAGKGSFPELLDRHVFQPLDMKHTREDHPYEIVPGRAAAYNVRSDDGLSPAGPSDNSYKWPSGGMIGTPTDLATLGLAFLEPGFLNEAQLGEIFKPQPNAGSEKFRVGLGWRMGKDDRGRTIYHHGGAIEGGRTFMLLIPKSRTVVVMMANAYANFGLTQALELADLFLEPGRNPN